MDKNYEKIENLLFQKGYQELSAEEQKLVDQYLGAEVYNDIGSLGKTPPFQSGKLEAALNTAYQKHYHRRGKSRFPYLGIAALIIGLCLCSSILTWYFLSVQMTPKFINVPEIIVLRDTVYLPAPEKIVIKEAPPKRPAIQEKPAPKQETEVIFAEADESTELYPDKELPSLVNLPVSDHFGSPNSEDTILTKELVKVY